ncbi:MAG: hypothetical protein V1837_07225 [Candidatus Woesearchaeota archaeon]
MLTTENCELSKLNEVSASVSVPPKDPKKAGLDVVLTLYRSYLVGGNIGATRMQSSVCKYKK